MQVFKKYLQLVENILTACTNIRKTYAWTDKESTGLLNIQECSIKSMTMAHGMGMGETSN